MVNLESQFFQEVGSRFYKRFDQLSDHRKCRPTSDLFQELQTSWFF